jgi:hypothetical protein
MDPLQINLNARYLVTQFVDFFLYSIYLFF